LRAIFASGRIVDIALALTALEAVCVVAYHRATGRGVPAADFLGNLLSGVCLMVALRVALGGGWWGWIAAALLAALLAHLWDLHRRWT
jgi:hypothetical protein